MTKEQIITLIKEKKISFIDLVFYFYQQDVQGSGKPTWLKPEQQKWIRDAFTLLNEAQL